MFQEDKAYRIREVCEVVNESKRLYRILYPALVTAWVKTGKLKGWRQEGYNWYCRGSDLNKSLLPFLGLPGDTTTNVSSVDTKK